MRREEKEGERRGMSRAGVGGMGVGKCCLLRMPAVFTDDRIVLSRGDVVTVP